MFCREIYLRFIILIDFIKCLTVVIKQYLHIALSLEVLLHLCSTAAIKPESNMLQQCLSIKNLPNLHQCAQPGDMKRRTS